MMGVKQDIFTLNIGRIYTYILTIIFFCLVTDIQREFIWILNVLNFSRSQDIIAYYNANRVNITEWVGKRMSYIFTQD